MTSILDDKYPIDRVVGQIFVALRWRKADSNSRSHLTGPCQIRDGSPFVMRGGSALERTRKPPRAVRRCGLGSGGRGGGSRFDPPDNVRPLQRALWLKELADFPQGPMHDHVDDNAVDAIFDSYAQDEKVARYLIWRPHRSRSETQAYVNRCIATPSEVERTYMLVSREDNVVRGAFALRQRAPHRLDCGYVLARRWWRRGLMTEVLIEVTVWALRQPSVFRVGAVCDVENIGSARVLERSGFVREGLLRRWLLHPNISDEPRDCYSYARVR